MGEKKAGYTLGFRIVVSQCSCKIKFKIYSYWTENKPWLRSSACNVGDLGSIPGPGRSPGEGNGNPLQYSCLENPMDRGAWWAAVHRVAKSRTQLSDFTFTFFPIGLFPSSSFIELDSINLGFLALMFLNSHYLWPCIGRLLFLPGEFQGRGSLVGCLLWGRTESDTTEAT